MLTTALVLLLAACSTTSNLPEGEKLYIGLDHIRFHNYEASDQAEFAKEEVQAVLECAPNGALFGSSYHRSPFPIGLWLWNAFSSSETSVGKWIGKTFGKAPLTVSSVNPELRTTVAESTLQAHGYMRGKVGYGLKQTSSPKKQRISYDVDMGQLFLLDSVAYLHFPATTDSLMQATAGDRLLRRDVPFDVGTLDEERTRLSRLFRNNGYYFFQPAYITYLADTVAVPGKVQLRVEMADSLDERVYKQWYIANIDINLRRMMREQLDNRQAGRRFTVHYHGRRIPLRWRVLSRGIRMRQGRLYKYDDYISTINALNGKGVFSSVDCRFTPRQHTQDTISTPYTATTYDTLDVSINCMFDKPYDTYLEANVTGKTNGFIGPGLTVGITKKNALRGGELLDVNLHGNYEWQTQRDEEGTGNGINSYEYGLDVSLEMPRLFVPFRTRPFRRYAPSTTIKLSANAINRAKYFRRHIVSGELTYTFMTSRQSRHQLSPLIFEYNYMGHLSDGFAQILENAPYLAVAMQDQFVPKMRYVYTYSSPATYRNPIYWETSVSQAGNLLAAGYAIAGKQWSKKEKRLFNNPFAQFLRFETDWRKTWAVGERASLVAHAGAGVIYSYGNAEQSPYTEQFYVGGANSIRAFNVRSIGPGTYHSTERKLSYVDQTGDIKLLLNLEYRAPLFGNLHGAVFIDAGNVWALHNKEGYRKGSKFDGSKLLDQLAVGTGVGLRYDLDFFVVRVDWGIGLHVPYNTGKSGYYNIPRFKDGQSIHLAIGYPF